MGKSIRISVPAHLHTGNMDLTGDLGRLYGTAGFTIQRPRTVVEASKAPKITASGEDSASAKNFAQTFIRKYNISGGVKINVKKTIPKHLGMGSQTALALAVGTAIAELYNKKVGLEEMALALGRSDIVALGLNSFRSGGFLVDGGYIIKKKGRMVPPLIFRHPIPKDWLFVVCIPEKPIPAILAIKADEDRILSELKRMPAQMSDRLSRLMLMQIMPAMAEGDIKAFGKSITEFNGRLGGFWDDFQQGRTYCHPIVESGIRLMLANGAYGACQTCWGPTFYGILDDPKKAEKLVHLLDALLKKNGGGTVFVTKGDNRGAVKKRW
jgi:beta-ribofuranosylaminobenzene 5'-phosphate synthase